jgi:hypothetical protein
MFALTSWGNAGIPWIGKCLNLHPSIHAFINIRAALGSLSGRNLNAAEYLHQIAVLARQNGVEHVEHYAVCGDLNGIGPHEFAELKRSFGCNFNGAHLMAHPIPRLAGSLAFSKEVSRHFTHDHFLNLWSLDRDNGISKKLLQILGESGDHIPAHYMMHVNGVIHVVGSAPLFRLEELASCDEEWDAMTRYLSGELISDYGPTWRRLEGMFIGVAHQPFSLHDPVAVWRSFSQEIRQVVGTMLTDGAREAYEDLGYDLSFVY